MKLKRNKLFASPTNNAMLEIAEKYPHSRATQKHILVIAEKKPKGFVEVKGELVKRLPADDVRWIMVESNAIWEEEKEIYQAELLEYAKDFSARFETELQKAAAEKSKEGLTDAGTGETPTE